MAAHNGTYGRGRTVLAAKLILIRSPYDDL